MRHITPGRLAELDGLLVSLRRIDGLVERSPGVFYRRSRAFLHFHEDPAGLFADVRLTESFTRMQVTTAAEQQVLLSAVEDVLH
jgi:hypothetical protein